MRADKADNQMSTPVEKINSGHRQMNENFCARDSIIWEGY